MEVGRVPVRPFSAGQPCWCAVEQELASTHKANLLPIAGEFQKVKTLSPFHSDISAAPSSSQSST